ncbi:hypothetical protein L484_004096 [Morus notabilis]|uniref:DUF7138 domain-containing protein n=1 Tax=Morus notabilis TaxID=981085 RepID=W9R4W3_9ROSA|nr:hypothetical protein L484_004096 [Morus notabilis]
MVEIPGGVSFPVVFFDGEHETEIGSIAVYAAMEFKRFQALLSQKIGISPHQFSVHLSSPESCRKIPITGKVNFGAICREKGCFFVVMLKRSRRPRRRKSHHHHQDFLDDVILYPNADHSPMINKNPPPNVMLLRRDASVDCRVSPSSDRVEYENRVLNLQLEREMYLVNMGLSGLGREPNETAAPVCGDCVRAKELGQEAGFHWCVYDAVTFSFRPPAGPIARPFRRPE